VEVEVLPAPANTGIVFVRDGIEIPAVAERVVETSRATVLGLRDTTVSTVEHVLSALFGMQVDNARIMISGPEVPVVDGSAQWFVGQIERATVRDLGVERATISLDAPIVERDGDRLIVALPAERFSVRCIVDFPHPVGSEYLALTIDEATYAREVAGARTFGYLHEVEALRARPRPGRLVGERGRLRPRWPVADVTLVE
jgi:UDP-3-O-[3-hydroxymyristoyl] N-acetylglucosamine deacetylase